MGVSPMQYLREVRLSRARALLQTDPTLTVQQVANRVGYNHAQKFHMAYRQAYGETPRTTKQGGAN
jgi:transcriptional regulator GlxA family with amidase domain